MLFIFYELKCFFLIFKMRKKELVCFNEIEIYFEIKEKAKGLNFMFSFFFVFEIAFYIQRF